MLDLNDCKRGHHNLISIFSTSSRDIPDGEIVVRWCKICGAVVVDFDLDGRRYPGDIRKLQIPLITQEHH